VIAATPTDVTIFEGTAKSVATLRNITTSSVTSSACKELSIWLDKSKDAVGKVNQLDRETRAKLDDIADVPSMAFMLQKIALEIILDQLKIDEEFLREIEVELRVLSQDEWC